MKTLFGIAVTIGVFIVLGFAAFWMFYLYVSHREEAKRTEEFARLFGERVVEGVVSWYDYAKADGRVIRVFSIRSSTKAEYGFQSSVERGIHPTFDQWVAEAQRAYKPQGTLMLRLIKPDGSAKEFAYPFTP